MFLYYYGARQDTRDERDHSKVYSDSQIPSTPNIDLRSYVDHVYDQGELGSCTASALCAAHGLDLKKWSLTSGEGYPSRLFLYYNTREYEGTSQHDAGASIRDTVKALNRYGVCTEEDWPYSIKEYRNKPPMSCYESARRSNLCKYERLNQDTDQLRACLSDQCSFIFWFNVYHSFHDYNNQNYGVMSMPTCYECFHEPIGRQTVMAVGYDDNKKHFIILNSWGEGWGDGGYFYMPYNFIKDSSMCYDFWKVTFQCENGQHCPCDTTSAMPVVLENGAGGSSCDEFSYEFEDYSECSDDIDITRARSCCCGVQ